MARITRLASAALLALGVVSSAPAQTVAVVGNGGQYGYFNLASPTNSYVQVSSNAFQNLQITGLAYTGSGSAGYAIARNANAPADLRTVNILTGANAVVGPINPGTNPPQSDYYGLAFNTANSTLYSYYNQDDTLRTVSTSSSVAGTVVGSGSGLFTTGSPFIGRLAFAGGTLYGTINNGTGSPQQGPGLYSFNTTTGVATFRGDGGGADAIYTNLLAFGSGSNLYGINGTTLYQINTTNGSLNNLGAITGLNLPAGGFVAAVIAPVPEPGMVLGAAAVGLGLARWVRRRRAVSAAPEA